MRIPHKIIIAGREWLIVFDSKIDGAIWHSEPGEIRIGKHKDKEERLIWFLHEVIEAILAVGNHRFECYPNKDNDIFLFDHKELIKIVREIYLAIKGMAE